MERSRFLKTLLLALAPLKLMSLATIDALIEVKGNFKRVYSDHVLQSEFYKFIQNIFHLYPTDKMDALIREVTESHTSDEAIFIEAQSRLSSIEPWFPTLSYQLPALFKQKEEMARQTVELLGKGSAHNGYLEIGSSGRYLDYLEEECSISGERYYADGKEPGYAISEMVDRGQITIGAEYIPFADHRTKYADLIPNESLGLVTNYIGFHHCPLDLRVPFISSIRDTLRVGGKLVLRDHDCHNEDQMTLVALAHDVFNMGTNESWDYNRSEVRNFYTLAFIIEFVEGIGFEFNGKTLFQDGDPTKNALMLFTKI